MNKYINNETHKYTKNKYILELKKGYFCVLYIYLLFSVLVLISHIVMISIINRCKKSLR